MIFSIDGMGWNFGCDVERAIEVRSSEISGYMLDGTYFNDVIGSYLQYIVKIAVPLTKLSDYNRLYRVLADPVDGHTFLLPYGNGTVEIQGRVSNISDVYVRLPNGKQHWKGIQFTVTANTPTFSKSLDSTIERGFAPLPPESTVDINSVYEYTASGWVEVDDADDTYY